LSLPKTDLFIAPIVTEICNTTGGKLAKNNQKKEKAERNKLYAQKYRKRKDKDKLKYRRNQQEDQY
jgi:hypothetical protein